MVTSMYGAEHGRAGAAIVNVVTRQGTNTFRGVAFAHAASDRLTMQKMLDQGIATRRGDHVHPPRTCVRGYDVALSSLRSEQAQKSCILLPLFHQMTTDMQVQVVTALQDALS